MAWLNRLRCGRSRNLSGSLSGSRSVVHPSKPIIAAAVTGLILLAAGCGNQYRPVVTPIYPTGPAGQPAAYIALFSQPGYTPLTSGTAACSGVTYSTPSVITLVDFSGDSIVGQAEGGNGPLTFSLDSTGSNMYAPNCDGTLINAPAEPGSSLGTVGLLTKNVETSTLLPGSAPTNTLLSTSSLYVAETGLHGPTCLVTNCVAQLTGSPEALKQEIPVAPSLINFAGYTSAERVYAISQGNSGSGSQPAWGDCANPSAVVAAHENGEADAIETSTNTISAWLPLGVCPVYGFMTPDTFRTFIMNRGSGTVTVINSQLNALDTQFSPTSTIAVGAGPVYADYYRLGQVLVTANYDSNTISIINVSLDTYGNDSTSFGTVLATVPVGLHPVEVTVLQDGSRVYVANQGDIASGTPGSVTVVNLSDYSVEKTIPLPGGFYPHAIASIYNYPIGKVYVVSQNSPYLEVISTDTDTITATPEMQGNIVDMRVSGQYPDQTTSGASNYQIESRSVGSGAP
ncbi:MAG: YncE family protein [Acidobacteriaceae bacterium]